MSYGRYRELALLGQGGMARVVLATLPSALGVQKLVVVKEILPELAADPEFIGMFTDEARIATSLDHPNLIQTFEFGEHDGRYFIAMEYLDGQSYSALIKRTRRELPLEVHLHVLTRVLAGLHHAHEAADLTGKPLGIVHRDISPQNVFLSYGGAIKVVDFGIAKMVDAQVKTRTGVFKGKLAYAASEQIANDPIDRRSDVFSVGVLLWEAIVGKKIAGNMPEPALLHQRLLGNDPKPRDENPDAPAELVAICERAMAHNPEDRYQTAAEMQAALEAAIDKLGLRTTDADVGALVAKTFDQERSNVRKLVQERIAAPPASGAPLAVIPFAPASQDNSGSANQATVSGARTTITHSLDRTMTAPGTRRRSRWRAAIIVFATVAIGAGLFALSRSRARPSVAEPNATATSSLAATPTASTPAAEERPAEPKPIEAVFVATPPTARFELDGIALEGNPHVVRRPSDDKPHDLRVVAPGFVSEQRSVVLDRDVRIELALRVAPTAPRAPQPPGSTSPKTAPVRTAAPIDTRDPWSTK